MCDIFTFKVSEKDKPSRIDIFLASKLENISRSYIQSLIKKGCIKKEDEIITDCKYLIKNEETYLVTIPKVKEIEIIAKKIDLDIVFEDEHFIIINKQAGLTVHPGAGNHQDTLVNGLLEYCGNNLSDINGEIRRGIVHRLDKGTSGLMLVAKTNEAHINLSNQISTHSLKRHYLSFCWGMPTPIQGTISNLIGRHPVNRKKMSVVKTNGKLAITHYKLLKTFLNGLVSLVECRLETGRTHQIRVHMTSISNPLLGDPEYGYIKTPFKKQLSKNILDQIHSLNRQSLHSFFIALKHPISNEYMEYTIDLPKDLSNIKKILEDTKD